MKGRFWRLLFLLPLSLAALPPAPGTGAPSPAAAPTAWTEIGPDGGDIRGLARNAANAKELFAAAVNGQVFKSANSGAAWQRIAVLDETLQDAACGPADRSLVVALGVRSLFTSADGGRTWTQASFPESFSAADGRVAIHPGDPRILYVAGRYKVSGKDRLAVLKSSNAGRTWTVSKPVAASGGQAVFVTVGAANPAVVYAGGSLEGQNPCILKSSDSGRSWQNITGTVAGTPGELAVDPADAQKIYLATSQAVFRSADGGRTWLRNNGTAFGKALAIDAAHPDILYASYSALGVYKSVNGGVDWITRRIESDTSSRRLLVASNSVFLTSVAGVWRSTNAGAAWKQSDSGIRAAVVTAVAVAPSSPRILYAADPNRGFVRSPDGGRSWETRWVLYSCTAVPRIVVHPRDPDRSWMIYKAG